MATVPHFSLSGQPRLGTNWADGILGARQDRRERMQEEAILAGRKSAVEGATNPDGSVNWAKAVQGLYSAGDLQGAQSVAAMANNEADRAWRREEAERAQRNADRTYNLQARRLAQSGESGGGVYGSPIYGKDPQTGETVLGAIGKDGSFRRLDTGGVQVTPGVTWQDFGTHRQGFDKSGAPVTPQVAIQNEQKAYDTSMGQAMGKDAADRRAGAPVAAQKAQESIDLIDGMIGNEQAGIPEHPGFRTAVGASSRIDPRNYMAGTAATDFNTRSDQLQGRAFLEAFESLKGGGQITEVEGQKATQAIARLSTAQSETSYKQALTELRGILQIGLDRARSNMGPQPAASPAQFRDGQRAQNAQGQIIEYRNGQWVPAQ